MYQLRMTVRALSRAPAFSVAVIASLALSLAAITTVFAVADAVLFRALPFRDPEKLVAITSVRAQRRDAPFSLPEYLDYARRVRSMDVVAYATWSGAMSTAPVARRLQGMRASANIFDVLGVAAAAGRLLRPNDDRADAPHVAVLSHAFWVDQFASDPRAVGRSIRLNDEPYEIVGVMPRYFPTAIRNVDVVVPLVPDRDPRRNVRTSTNFLRLIGRVKAAASLSAATSDISAVAAELRAQFPTEYASKLGVAVTPLRDALVGVTRQTFVVMLGAGALLLGIAFANVLSLCLVRGVATRGQMSLRRALGASPRRLGYQATMEALLLVAVAASLGTLLAKWLVSAVARSSLPVLRVDEARVTGHTLLFVVVVSVAATLLFSAIQLAVALRVPTRDALTAIGRAVRGTRGDARLRFAFLLAQVAFAVLLTIVTSTMARSLSQLQSIDLGYRPDSVFVARLSLPPLTYRTVADLSRFTAELEGALRAEPEVVAAGAISIAPLSGNLAIIPFSIAGRTPRSEHERLEANLRAITPGYFSAIRAQIRSGRDLRTSDDAAAPRIAVISRALADRYFDGRDPLGQQLLIDDNSDGPRPVSVVGVVENMHHVDLDGPASVDIYIPVAQIHRDGLGLVAGSQFWAVRIASGGSAYARTFVGTLARVDAQAALAGVQPMRAYVDDTLGPRRVSVLALVGFALVALVLASVGVYGLVAYSVEQRRREIGLRLALGATGRDITRAFLAPALGVGILGAAAGVGGAILTRKLVAGLLFGVTPTEPSIVATVALSLVGVSAIAALVPARRAAAVDPAVTLSGADN